MLIFAEALGAIAVVINFISYRQNDINHYRLISAIALAFLCVHFYLLDAMAAFVVLLLSSIRNLLAMRWQNMWMVHVFLLLNFGFWGYELFWLQNPWYVSIAYGSSVIFIVGTILIQNATLMRKWFVLAEAMGLLYCLLVGSIFGTVFNTLNLISILHKLYLELRYKAEQGGTK